ncbi:MAG: hypothetical protein NTV22_13275 [bacterium]|nr:hypothetical protein [bacterium]
MQLTVKVSQEGDGQYRARCPELGLSTLAHDLPGAVDRLKTMILDVLTYDADVVAATDLAEEPTEDSDQMQDSFALLHGDDGVKFMVMPRHQRTH